MKKNINKILIPMPNKVYKGGICSYWSAIFTSFKKFNNIGFEIVKVGNRGKNIFGPPMDQWIFYKAAHSEIDLVVLNPSILNKAFFREAIFAQQLVMKKIPFIVFFHGWDLDFEKRVDKYYTKVFIKTYAKAEKIIVLSPEAKEKIIEWGYRGKVYVETTIVDSALINDFSFEERIESQNFPEKIKILFLARMEKEKGVYELIEAFKRLQYEFPKLELILAGNGSNFEEVNSYVSGLKNIKLLGHVEGSRKAKVFRESDIYCLPSYSEGLPVSVLEAMAFGLPIITTSVGGLKHFFKEDMGYISIPKDVEDLIEKLKLLLLAPKKINQIGKFNFDYAQQNLASDIVSKRLYTWLIEK